MRFCKIAEVWGNCLIVTKTGLSCSLTKLPRASFNPAPQDAAFFDDKISKASPLQAQIYQLCDLHSGSFYSSRLTSTRIYGKTFVEKSN